MRFSEEAKVLGGFAALAFGLLMVSMCSHAAIPLKCIGDPDSGRAQCLPLTPAEITALERANEPVAETGTNEAELTAPPSMGEVVAASIASKVLAGGIALLGLGLGLEIFWRVSGWARLRIGSERESISQDPLASAIYSGAIWVGLCLMVGMVLQ